jgi:hypothetical protein
MENLLKSKEIKWVLIRRTDSGEIEGEIDRAIERYEERHGAKANTAYCQNKKFCLALAARGLAVRPGKYCGTLFYYLGYVPEEVTNVEGAAAGNS